MCYDSKTLKTKVILGMNKNVSILGCGWLGLPLAVNLAKSGFKVKASKTSNADFNILENNNIEPLIINFKPDSEPNADFFATDILVICFPPKVKHNGVDFYLEQIKNISAGIIDNIKLQKLIFISSTSVYGEHKGNTLETDGNQEHFLYKAEKMLIESLHNKEFYALRFGGLMGYDRNPCKYITVNSPNIAEGVNYIHQDDAVSAILAVVNDENSLAGVYNVVSPIHPSRIDILEINCKQIIANKNQLLNSQNGKLINPNKFIRAFNFKFKYDNPLDYNYL